MTTSASKVGDSRKELVAKIIENMNKGYIFSPALWNNLSIRPYNPVSNCYYKGGNLMRVFYQIEMHGYKDPRWCTYKQASQKDWQIKRGEKGTLLEKWIFTKEVTEKDALGKPVKKSVLLDHPVANYFYVFNGEQIAGIPELPHSTPEHEINELTNKVIASSKCPITECAQPQAFYIPSLDTITLPLRDTFKSPESFLSVCLHEMSHSTGHSSRLNRAFATDKNSPIYAFEELVAELSSAFASVDLGLSVSGELLNDHSNYLKSWISQLKKDENSLFRACKYAEDASLFLYQNYMHTNVEIIDKKEFLQKNSSSMEINPGYSSASYPPSILLDIKKSGFQPTLQLCRNIQSLQNELHENISLKEVSLLQKEKNFQNSAQQGDVKKLVDAISTECREQQLFQTVSR